MTGELKRHSITLTIVLLVFLLIPVVAGETEQPPDAEALVRRMVDYYRGNASRSIVEMTIHRPEWERTMAIKVWTQGRENSLFYITAPPKDQGNGTLKRGREIWTYNPKVNRVIQLPPSMMSQSWMGSDFSNNDIARSDSVIEDYDHTLESVQTSEGIKVYVIRSIPKPAAPVVWGMQKLYVREDLILIRQEFFDEGMQLVKRMNGSEIQLFGNKRFPGIWRMEKAEEPEEYTQLEYRSLEFMDELPDRLFTVSSLRNPGR